MLNESENGQVKLNLMVSTDNGAFLRQTCASCGLDFKAEVDEANLAHLLEEEASFVGAKLGQSIDPLAGELERTVIHCPYCRFQADPEDLITEERHDYFVSILNERLIRPALDRMFSNLGGRASGSGSFSISISRQHSVPPPSPLEGPEPNDMIPILLLCCKKRIKVLRGWRSIEHCPYCVTSIRVE